MKKFKIRASQIGKIMTNAKSKGDLSAGCKTYLKEWYAEQMFGTREEIRSKYFDKGNICEGEAIDMIAVQLNLGMLAKNEEHFENDFMTGTPDVITEKMIIDAKCSWDGKTFLDAITSKINSDYEWQLQGYMNMTGKEQAKVCYCLLDTPEEANFGNEMVFSHIEPAKRFFAFDVVSDPERMILVKQKVEQCNVWLEEYDQIIKTLLKC